MWIFLLIVLAVVVYFVLSQASNSNQASKASSRTQASKASSQNYTNQVDYSNLEIRSLETSGSNSFNWDYRHLRDLLAEGKWREADKETSNMILLVTNHETETKGIYLSILILPHTPCEDICIIDRLWLKYSNGRFGFSVQRRIISDIGEEIGEKNALSIMCDYKTTGESADRLRLQVKLNRKFHERIGWNAPDRDTYGYTDLKDYNDLTFSIQAPYGHLPTLNRPELHHTLENVNDVSLLALLMRFSKCGIAL
ncbi:GUN4 domain-containing protein [Microcoleus anatoxicus]|uniref:GUN4 domain-containing protein n=1 Tax=Microcoleus anatoxicus PTRS2 TaxID=2705321 RepID=A0ABU8YTU5_9CYAN